MQKIILTLLGCTIFFVYINNPLFSFLGGYSALYLFVPFLILLPNRKVALFVKENKNLLVGYLALIIFCILRTFLGGEAVFIRQSFFQMLSFLLIAGCMIVFFDKNNIKLEQLVMFLAWTSVIITILCLVFPSFNSFIKYSLTIPNEDNEMSSAFRGFGLSGSLTSGYGAVLAFSFAYFLKNGLFKYKVNLLIIPLLVLSILLNARTGLILFLGFLFIYCLFNKRKALLWIAVLAVGVLFFPSLEQISFLNDETKMWLQEFFYEIQDALTGTSNAQYSVVDTYTGDFLIWPSSIEEWIIGRGYSVFKVSKELSVHSDIGFIRQLNYGGIIYLFIIMYIYLSLIKKCNNRYFQLCAIFMLLVANIKGDFLSGQDGYRLLNFVILYDYYKQMTKTTRVNSGKAQ